MEVVSRAVNRVVKTITKNNHDFEVVGLGGDLPSPIADLENITSQRSALS